MKKYFKLFLVILFCLTLKISYVEEKQNTFKVGNLQEGIADYNELYGIDEILEPQIQFKSKRAAKQSLKYLAVFIEFADSDLLDHHLDDEQSVKNAEMLFNDDNLIEMESVNGKIKVPSFKKYMEMQSYGKFSLSTEIFPKQNNKVASYKDAHPVSYYLKYSKENPNGYKDKEEALERETALINNAVANVSSMIESSGITADEIDTGNDGIVDAISFFIEGQNMFDVSIGWNDLLWSHKMDNYGITETILGKRVIPYNLLYTYDYTETVGLFSLTEGTYGTIIHEFGHTLGFADLYRFDHSGSTPVGFYDIMGTTIGSNPQNLLTYFTSEYDTEIAWHKPVPVINKSTKGITLKKPQFIDDMESRAIKLKTDYSDKEFFIVEYHEKQNTYASSSADTSGIIVYRVNENNKYAGNTNGGDYGELDHIFIFRPNEPHLGAGLGDLTKATLNATRNTLGKKLGTTKEFDNETIYYANGNNSGIEIKVTGETTDTITFDVTFPSLEGDGTKASPYLIPSSEAFLNVMKGNTKGKYYKLTADLDFKNMEYPEISFVGNLDGNGKTVKNVVSKTGLFDFLGEPGTLSNVSNLFVLNLVVSSSKGKSLGGFASVASNVIIENVHLLSGMVTNVESLLGNSLDATGGFIGNAASDTIIRNCSSSLEVSSPKNVGGFIGINLNAKIEDCFTDAKVNGKDTIGAFIGLQCIMDSSYKTPERSYYKVDGNDAVGGYHKSLHNQNVLKPANIDIGIVGLSIASNLNMKYGSDLHFLPTTTDGSQVHFDVIIENKNLLAYDNGLLKVLNSGTTNVYTDILIGTFKMRLVTKVISLKEEGVISETEVLKYAGLTKKSGYVIGFPLGTNISNIKRTLSSISGVTLKSFKSADGKNINTGIVATGMTFILSFNNREYNYTIVIKGDVNGDGFIYATDYVRIKNHIMGKSTLKGAYFMAADINSDGNMYATDYVKVRNHIMGKSTIAQKWV